MTQGRHAEVTAGKSRGFTLIELMVTVAIVAILATIAIPSYNQYAQKARRADAKAALEIAKSRAEKYFLNNGSYPPATSPGTDELALMNIPAVSERGYYAIRYNYDDSSPLSDTNPYFQATAINGQPQYSDNDCRTFQVGLDGTRSAAEISGSGGDSSTCW